MNFGENLRDLRKSRKMSQESLAEKVNVSRQSISKWENGEAYPEMKNIMILCDIFNCKINELVNEDVSDVNSLDDEVKQVVIKFKENQQKRIKLLSKVTYVMAKIAKIVFKIITVCMLLGIISVPFISKYITMDENTITIFNKEIEYSIDEDNILTLNGEKYFINSSTNLNEFIPNHSKTFFVVSVEYILICFLIQIICMVLLLHYIEKLYKNIYEKDTPFILENVKYMNFITLFLGIQLLFPKISATIYSLVVRLDLAIEYNFINVVVILIVLSLTYIFKYGYEIQLDSKGKIYGNNE